MPVRFYTLLYSAISAQVVLPTLCLAHLLCFHCCTFYALRLVHSIRNQLHQLLLLSIPRAVVYQGYSILDVARFIYSGALGVILLLLPNLFLCLLNLFFFSWVYDCDDSCWFTLVPFTICFITLLHYNYTGGV